MNKNAFSHERIRDKGECYQCRSPLEINSHTGKYYWKCKTCRRVDVLLHQGYNTEQARKLLSEVNYDSSN